MRENSPPIERSPPLGLSIEVARPDHLEAVLKIAEDSTEVPHWSVEIWKGLVAPQPPSGLRRVLFIARSSDGPIAGLLAASIFENTSELELLFVSTQIRRHGIGRALMQRWLQWAAEHGAGQAWLEVRASNAAALTLYGGAGFEQQGRRKAYYTSPVEDAMTLRRAV